MYDELISRRPYKEPVTPEVAFDIIEQISGHQFDPRVVESFRLIKDEIMRIS